MANDLTTPNNCLKPTFLGVRKDVPPESTALEFGCAKKTAATKQAPKNRRLPTNTSGCFINSQHVFEAAPFFSQSQKFADSTATI
jgi:hypothetical protein